MYPEIHVTVVYQSIKCMLGRHYKLYKPYLDSLFVFFDSHPEIEWCLDFLALSCILPVTLPCGLCFSSFVALQLFMSKNLEYYFSCFLDLQSICQSGIINTQVSSK